MATQGQNLEAQTKAEDDRRVHTRGRREEDNVIVDWWAAGAVYILHPLCLYWLVVLQGLHLGFAAVLGLHVYSSYELTNKATLRRWPRWLVAFDCVWGMTLYTVVVVVVRRHSQWRAGLSVVYSPDGWCSARRARGSRLSHGAEGRQACDGDHPDGGGAPHRTACMERAAARLWWTCRATKRTATGKPLLACDDRDGAEPASLRARFAAGVPAHVRVAGVPVARAGAVYRVPSSTLPVRYHAPLMLVPLFVFSAFTCWPCRVRANLAPLAVLLPAPPTDMPWRHAAS